MRLVTFLIVALAMGTFGCSSGSKNSGAQAPVAVAPPTATPQVPAQENKVSSATTEWRCTKGVDVRTIQVEGRTPKGCRLLYPNAQSEVATSAIGDAHCIQVRSRIRGNLEKAGFTCTN